MPGSSLLRSLSTFGVVILGAASACVHAASLPLNLVPSRDQNIIGDELIRGIVTTGPASVHGPEMVSTGPVFVGDEAAAIRIDSTARGTWMLDLEFAETLDMLGYSSFRFAFHPGGASGTQLAMGLGEYDLWLLTRRTTRIHLNRREWQMVEFPLDVFQRERVIPTITFQGDLRGTFYFDDMRLVSKQQLTAVEEDTNPTPNQTTLEAGYPNPFNSSVTIPFQLAESGPIRLDIYNVTG